MTQPRARRFLRTKQTILDAALEIVRTENPTGAQAFGDAARGIC